MAEQLTESAWTGFTKKHKLTLDDAPLVKALSRLERIKDNEPAARKDALDDLAEVLKKQVPLLVKRKKELGDKLFSEAKDKLYALLDEAEKQAKNAERAAQEAADDEESPALLTTKMIPLIRELRKGEVTMQALIALAGKETVVLLSRRAISPARGKLLKEQMENPSGLKFIRGECLLENNAFTFVVQSPAAGLAKRLRAALLAQTELRLKVRVRGDDGAEDDDGEDGGSDLDAPASSQPIPKAPPRPPGPDPLAAFNKRLAALMPDVKSALAVEGPHVAVLKALVARAGELGQKRDFAAADEALRELQAALADAPRGQANLSDSVETAAKALRTRMAVLAPRVQKVAAGGSYKDALLRLVAGFQDALKTGDLDAARRALGDVEVLLETAGESGGPKESGGRVDYAKARLAWIAARKSAQADLKKLEQAIIAEWKNDREALPIVTKGVRKLDRILVKLDEKLADILDDALNAQDPARRSEIHALARDRIDDYMDYLTHDPLVRDIDDNPFVSIGVASALKSVLADLSAQLT